MPEENEPEVEQEVSVSDVANSIGTLQLTVESLYAMVRNVVQAVLFALAVLMFSAAMVVMFS